VLATWNDPLAGTLSDCLPAFERGRDLVPVELALDRSYFRQSLRALRGPGSNRSLLARLLRHEIDLANAKAARRLALLPAGAAVDHAQFAIDGGEVVDAAAVAGLLDPKLRNRRLRSLRGTPYYAYLAGSGDPVQLEDELDHAFWRRCARLYRARPLAIDVAVGFLWQKYYELVNLRLLARAKYYGLPSAQVQAQLFLDIAGS
jgi:V/A-type H+/Na+-transporting ATPase subunit C